jgi:two-component system, chemotaxis family, protein-glutamate methylesterase/glutaminase
MPTAAQGDGRARERAVVIGASAGGVEALIEIVAGLPLDFPAPLLVVLHVSSASRSVLPSILTHAGALAAVHPADGEALAEGVVYVAPQNRHLLAIDGRARLSSAPTEHGLRPGVDPLFRSAARSYGPAAIAVVLSGTLDDGTSGLREIKRAGGIAIVQDPDSAAFDEMPRTAIDNVDVDLVMSPTQIARALNSIVRWPVPDAPDPGPEAEAEEGMTTAMACPQCGQPMREQQRDDELHYRCRDGHAFTADTLPAVPTFDHLLDSPASVRDLRRRGELLERLAIQAREHGRKIAAERFRVQAMDVAEQADALELELAGQMKEKHK